MSTKDELQQVEADLARLRAEIKDMRDQIGEVGATDQVEISSMISQADEQEELAAELERRRDALRQRLESEG
jgi:septal ring factor EnvC (AmiA/AmiB activator)